MESKASENNGPKIKKKIELTPEQTTEIKNAYYDPKIGYSIAKIKKLFGKKYTLKQIQNVVKSDQQHEIVQKITDKQRTDQHLKIAAKPGEYQADLMFMPKKYKRINGGYDILSLFISISSRRAFAYPLKSKTADDVIHSIDLLLADQKNIPEWDRVKNISTDAGKEYSKKVNAYLASHNIGLYKIDKTVAKSNATAIVERFVRTVRDMLDKYMKLNKTNTFTEVINDMITNYNNSEHRMIEEKPTDMTEKKALEQYEEKKQHNREIYHDNYKKFKVGDFVRTIKERKQYQKGAKWVISDKIYVIEKIIDNRFIIRNVTKKIASKREYFIYELVKTTAREPEKYNEELRDEERKIQAGRKLKREDLD